MYAPQRAMFPRLEVPRWIQPLPRESLADYARRMASKIDTSEPFFLGGASFGGMVALEMARHVHPRAVFLIGSCRAPTGVPWSLRCLGRMARFVPGAMLGVLHALAARSASRFGELTTEQHDMLVTMMCDADPRFLQWGGGALARWAGARALDMPVHQIHGSDDRIMPCRFSSADMVVTGAGHLLNVTHADVVNRFLAERMSVLS